ncbi:aspartyl protease family protein 2-like [Cicer arietinum]|uniref:Aspartyl protease family protein 2-like n=1 Tax=Cicer arietinum TaxID=3827 RepID=A0A1S2Y757_CICAR|nr:aspartyl protease family protein 2-like [Cicer arietinum]
MILKVFLILVLISIISLTFKAYIEVENQNGHNNDPILTSSEFLKPESIEKQQDEDASTSEKLHLMRLPFRHGNEPRKHVLDSTIKDLVRIQTLHRKVIEKKNTNIMPREKDVVLASLKSSKDEFSGNNMMATLVSGASLGTGEYFIDMFIGTPPKHVWLILDTGSDLNWIQCVPCYDCFEQNGSYYDPKDSSSFKNISCRDPRCPLVSSLDRFDLCEDENQTCPYFYDYADGSNTTGDFSLETFNMNLTWPNGDEKMKRVVDIMFGCGHFNKGYFHGAYGLLGLGRGPLSFSSQLQSIYGHSFSYCLDDLFSNTSTSSKLIFGENKDLLDDPNLNFTTLLDEQESPNESFYYLKIKSIIVGGEMVDIPEQIWNFSLEGDGGTIIDSGSTLTYFPSIAYDIIKDAFKEKIKLQPIYEVDFVMDTCYNVSGGKQVELPEFGIHFADGSVWNFPVENVFYPYELNEVLCLAILETPHHSSTIIGNLLQQNFHILYDIKNYRLGYSPRRCAEV